MKNLKRRLCHFVMMLFGLFSIFALNPAAADEPDLTITINSPSSPPKVHPSLVGATITGLTLIDCYKLALKQSETLAINQQRIKEAESHFWQGLSGVLPHLDYSYSDKRQNGTGGTSFTLSEIPERKFVFSQPLFSGFKEFAAMAATRHEKRQRIQEDIRARQLLFTDVSDAFYFFLSYQEDLTALNTTDKALKDRIEELNKRIDVGRSRMSEMISAQVRLSTNEAEIELVSSQATMARELLEFLTGEVIEAVIDSESVEPPSFSQEEYTSKAGDRPDVKASEEAWMAAQKQITVARAGYWPTVGVDGNYYDKRAGASEGVTWDVTLTIDFPIFDGLRTRADVSQARALANEADLTFQKTKREAILDIQNAYAKIQSSWKRNALLQKAYEAAEKNYQLEQEDYRHNLVNNLEVLQALEDWQTAYRSFISIKTESKQNYWAFKAATGDLPL